MKLTIRNNNTDLESEKFDIEVPAENHFINILHEFVKNVKEQNYKSKYELKFCFR